MCIESFSKDILSQFVETYFPFVKEDVHLTRTECIEIEGARKMLEFVIAKNIIDLESLTDKDR